MIAIPLTQGKTAIVDDDCAYLASYKWRAQINPSGICYAIRDVSADGSRKHVWLHRAVLGIDNPSVRVDHRNGDGLDCRRANLREASAQQNQANKRYERGSTRFKGVHWRQDRGRFRARLTVGGNKRCLGHFATAEDAARAYDAAAREAFGEFAAVNFPAAGERLALRTAAYTGPGATHPARASSVGRAEGEV